MNQKKKNRNTVLNTKKRRNKTQNITAFQRRKKTQSNCIFYRTHLQNQPWVPMERETEYTQESHRRK